MWDFFFFFLMEIATPTAEATTRTGLPRIPPPPPTQPLTWQLDVKSLLHKEQIDASTSR